jgi:hypothetical protein
MAGYWALGAGCNYARLITIIPNSNGAVQSLTLFHGVAFLVTIECQRHFNQRFDRYGREPDLAACLVFALANGIFETLCFVGVYDFGRHELQKVFALSTRWAIVVGWTLYYIYSAVIHVAFWLPLAFPKHTKAAAPPFHKHGLPLLTIISVAWFTIYERYGDLRFVCLLHAIMDGWGAWNIGLQGPWSSSDTAKQEKKSEQTLRVADGPLRTMVSAS